MLAFLIASYYDVIKRMSKTKMKAARTSVSMPEQMMVRAQRRVRGTFPTFSAYVQHLVRNDLARAKAKEATTTTQPA